MRKQAQYSGIKGMNQDLSISKYSPEFTFRNYNMRLNSMDSNTMFTLTNSKGNKQVDLRDSTGNIASQILGYTINYTVIDKYLVLFTTTRKTTTPLSGTQTSPPGVDRIYRIVEGDDNVLNITELFSGNLNFAQDALIESIGWYESENLIKVYWVDKNNQPRLINIVSNKSFTSKSFDFCPELNLTENYTLTKLSTGGNFHSGVIQYAFSYWNLNGVESNIFITTDLVTISDVDKGGSPESTHSCSFSVQLTNLETNFDYLRMYAIQRTSLEGVPNVRIVRDIDLKSLDDTTVSVVDDGISGSTFPAESLLFIGGEELILGTIASKDNALFGGDITLKRPSLSQVNVDGTFSWEYKDIVIEEYNPNGEEFGLYSYKPYTLGSSVIRHWKKNEVYRWGIRGQYKTGIWSEVLYIGDYAPDIGYKTTPFDGDNWEGGLKVSYVVGKYTMSATMVNNFLELGFKKAQLVYVPISEKDRSIVAQGFFTNTIAKIRSRMSNTPFGYPDYFTRGNNEFAWGSSNDVTRNDILVARLPVFDHFKPIGYKIQDPPGTETENKTRPYVEISGVELWPEDAYENQYIDTLTTETWEDYKGAWFIDKNLVDFWSPDVEFGNVRHNIDTVTNINFRGIANISSSALTMKYFFEKGSSDEWLYSKPNYSVWSNFLPISFPIFPYRSNNTVSLNVWSTIWDYDTLNATSTWHFFPGRDETIEGGTYGPTIERVLTRFVYCGFNDMLISEDGSTFFPIYTPTMVDRDDSLVNHRGDIQDGSSGSIVYGNHVNDLGELHKDFGTVNINYKANHHLLITLKDGKTLPVLSAAKTKGLTWIKYNFTAPYYRQNKTSPRGFITPEIDNVTRLGISDSDITSRKSVDVPSSGYSYLWIADLVREVPASSKYGGNTTEAIEANTWIPAGEAVILSNDDAIVATANYGDTFIQRYDVLRITNNNSTIRKTSEVVSVLLESYTNIDGRYDTKRGNSGIENYHMENYSFVNPVYSQKNNIFTSNIIDYTKFNVDKMGASFIVSQPKKNNEFIDNWTGLWLSNTYEADGTLGKINKLERFRNEVWGFQEKGIFQILYNSRVQIPVSDGVPIEISQSLKTEGVRYITNSIGATNKWAIKQSTKSLYFLDTINKDIYTLGDPPVNLSEQLGFKSWASNELKSTQEFDLVNNTDAFVINVDNTNDDIYFNNSISSLSLSERLNTFESFHSHEGIPWMVSFRDKFLSLKPQDVDEIMTTTIWENNSTLHNTFYGEKQPSSIEFHLNPEPHLDKVFDNFEYRADIIDENNVYLSTKTFKDVVVWNEYQYGASILNTPASNFGNKKFRTWSFPFPRARRSMDRIRNPWTKLKLTYQNTANHKLHFHDMIITYTI